MKGLFSSSESNTLETVSLSKTTLFLSIEGIYPISSAVDVAAARGEE